MYVNSAISLIPIIYHFEYNVVVLGLVVILYIGYDTIICLDAPARCCFVLLYDYEGCLISLQ